MHLKLDAKEVMKIHDLKFSSRPQVLAGKIIGNAKKPQLLHLMETIGDGYVKLAHWIATEIKYITPPFISTL